MGRNRKPRKSRCHLSAAINGTASTTGLSPPQIYRELDKEFKFDFDPCPYPLPKGFNGLTCEWGKSNFVNPPFASITMPNGKKAGVKAWVRKAMAEAAKGKRSVFLINVWDADVLLLRESGIRVLNFAWLAIEDGSPSKRMSNVAVSVIKPKPKMKYRFK